ncbi:hypothetical protein B7R54_01910 [Subtercola boreus]|uniref:Glucokinase n=1 Tax=Subtercola boreus TaxID=120213 RepID=A0A3E0VGV7_9MICO|nr:ROK family protein [Subtercola boreus]RFA08107.1 hypothetical protein B7R54_01910 [Subtercola boreus]TQL55006.1 glucokinase [Subtercola boreus]
MSAGDLVLGIDIGGTKTAAGLVDPDGRVWARASARTPADLGPEAVVETAIRLAIDVLSQSGASPVLGCGVGSAGVIEPGVGRVVSATSSLPGWAGTPLARVLSTRLRMPVSVVNDVHAHAVGESRFGAGRGVRTVLMVAAGTGIGGALVIDGTVQTGAHGASGHLGHMPSAEASGLPCTCGRSGHLEAVASGPAIASLYRARALPAAGEPVAHAEAVFALADDGDPLAATVIDSAGVALGRTLGGLINALDPDVVVVGGGLSDGGDRWWSAVSRGVETEVIPVLRACPIVPAELGGDAALAGAAAVFRSEHPALAEAGANA